MTPIAMDLQPSVFTATHNSHCFKFHTIFANKNTYKSSFLPATIPLWNNLPSDIVNCGSLKHFKLLLNNYKTITFVLMN